MYEGSGFSTSSRACVRPRLIVAVRVSQPGASLRARGWPSAASSSSLHDPALCDVGLTETTVVMNGEDKPWPNATCSAAQAWVITSAPSWYLPFCSVTPSNAWLTFQIYQHVCASIGLSLPLRWLLHIWTSSQSHNNFDRSHVSWLFWVQLAECNCWPQIKAH